MFSVFFCFVFVVLASLIPETQGCCRNLRFTSDPKHGRLNNHVIRTIDVSNVDFCEMQCYLEPNCLSYNFKKKQEDNGQHKCDLNNVTYDHNEHSGDFEQKLDFVYRGAKNACAKKPCQNSGTCQVGFTDRDYQCLCISGFTGDHCESVGWHSAQPGHSCKHIRDSRGSKGDGEYWIDPEKNGTPLKVFCDMTTDGGGWLLVSNVVINSSSSAPQLSLETSYRGIRNYFNNKTFLKKSAMHELRALLAFTQLRFHCSKQGRTFHVTTVGNSTGEAVVKYFSGQTDAMPEACGSFVSMENDNSRLAGVCYEWGKENGVFKVGKWGYQKHEDRLYNHAAFREGSYHWLLGGQRWECDDFRVGVSSGDFWKVFVR